ncbi:MAG: tRNA threonylcarbamoyladenosine dehydratase [Clostridia bacterium]|nr:tRNA threonylcarbamoyladenosine dehydratase [Clostridia bacterium]
MKAFDRVETFLGKSALEQLKKTSVAVFGAGGVGSFCLESLARSGVGKLTVVDADTVDESNLNRQLIATESTVGKSKVDAVKERLLSINPELQVETIKLFYLPDNADSIDMSQFDYVVDAVDTVSAKLEIICRAVKAGVKVITCMGTGGKLKIESLRVSTVEKTSGCPLARVMRRELKTRGITGVKAVWSEESTVQNKEENSAVKADGKTAPPSMIFVPGAAGLMLAREVVLDIVSYKEGL